MEKRITLLVMAIFLVVTAASAAPFNSDRPFAVNAPAAGESSLQQILDENFGGSIDAIAGQSSSAIWQTTDGSPAAYAVAFMKGDAGNFGIYSFATGEEVVLMSNPAVKRQTSFNIDAEGQLLDGNGTVLSESFGFTFGFFWNNTVNNNVAYTEDSKNGDVVRALTYMIPDGTQLTGTLASYFAPSGQIARGDDDWILAFEDRVRGADNDFQDAVFYVKDIDPVPEPGTLILLGSGLLGICLYVRKRA